MLAAAVVVVVVLIVCLLVVGVRRATAGGRRSREELLDEAVSGLVARMDALSRDVSAAVERIEGDGVLRAELGVVAEPEEILERLVRSVSDLPGVGAVLARVNAGDGTEIVAAHGVSADAAPSARIESPDATALRSVSLTYNHDAADEVPRLRAGIVVTLRSEGTTFGSVVAWGADELPTATGQAVERAGEAASPRLAAALGLARAPGDADRDTVTALPARRAFHDAVQRETTVARKRGLPLAIGFVDLDDFGEKVEREGIARGDVVLREFSRLLAVAVGPADLACRVGGNRFAVVAPGATARDLRRLYAAVAAPLAADLEGTLSGVTFSMGIAELEGAEDGVSLVARAERGLVRAKDAGKATWFVEVSEPARPRELLPPAATETG